MTICGFGCRFTLFTLIMSGILGILYVLLVKNPSHEFGVSFGMLLLLTLVSLGYVWIEITYFHSKIELNGAEYHMPVTPRTGDVSVPSSEKKEEQHSTEVCI